MDIKKDCFAYNSEKNECNALNDLYCKCENCSFYKNKETIDVREIERSIREYIKK